MTLPIGADTATVIKRTQSGVDIYNVPTMTETRTAVPGCSLQPARTTETITDTDLTVSMYTLFAPPVTAIQSLTAADAVEVSIGGVATVIEDFGDPEPFTDLDGVLDHFRILLRKARG